MWIREKLDEIIKRIKQIQKTIIRKSEENMNVIMPGLLICKMHNQFIFTLFTVFF